MWKRPRGGEDAHDTMGRCSVLECGRKHYYAGEGDSERLDRIVHPCGKKEHFKGDAGHERKVRVEEPGGRVVHYEGEADHER